MFAARPADVKQCVVTVATLATPLLVPIQEKTTYGGEDFV